MSGTSTRCWTACPPSPRWHGSCWRSAPMASARCCGALSLATPSRRSGSPGWPRGPIPDSGGATRYLALSYWPELMGAAGVMLIGQVAMSFVGPLDQYAPPPIWGPTPRDAGLRQPVAVLDPGHRRGVGRSCRAAGACRRAESRAIPRVRGPWREVVAADGEAGRRRRGGIGLAAGALGRFGAVPARRLYGGEYPGRGAGALLRWGCCNCRSILAC